VKSTTWLKIAKFVPSTDSSELSHAPTPFPELPWQMIGTDLFELDNLNYLIVVDYFSRYIEVAAMQKTTKSHEVIRTLKAIFARHGIPEEVRSDNGPQ